MHGVSQGIQLSFLFCMYHFSFNNCVLSIHYIPGSRCWGWNNEQENQILDGTFSFSLEPQFGFGNVREEASPGICPQPDWFSLSWMAFLLPVPSLLLFNPCPMKLFLVPFLLSICLYLCCLCLFTCQSALFLPVPFSARGHFPSSVIQYSPCLDVLHVFLSLSFLREQKPFGLWLRRFLDGEMSVLFPLVFSLTPSSCSGLFFSYIHCICKHAFSLNLLFYL